MMEDCATGMSTTHGCNGDREIVAKFKEALMQRVGEDVFRVYFGTGVTFNVVERDAGSAQRLGQVADKSKPKLEICVRGQFALDRLRKNYLQSIRGAAMHATGSPTDVKLALNTQAATQIELPLGGCAEPGGQNENLQTRSDSQQVHSGRQNAKSPKRRSKQPSIDGLNQPELPCMASGDATVPATDRSVVPGNQQTVESFVVGDCNRLAYTAAIGACSDPRSASPLFLSGPTGTGKSHLLSAIADQFRRRHGMRRVVHLSAEKFTNDFVTSVGTSGLPAFRARYRDVDALLVDDIQFLGSKRATLREMLYTAQTLISARRPLILSANAAPSEIPGLESELAGRLSCGLILQHSDAKQKCSWSHCWKETLRSEAERLGPLKPCLNSSPACRAMPASSPASPTWLQRYKTCLAECRPWMRFVSTVVTCFVRLSLR